VRGVRPEQEREFLVRISTSADRMDRLIADALNYSRLVRQELPLTDVDAGALLLLDMNLPQAGGFEV